MPRRVPAVLVPALAIVLASCASVTRVPTVQLPAPLEGAALGYSLAGDAAYSVTAASRSGELGCRVAYETYEPARPASDVMVLLAHGFMRDLASMRGWAALWASHGVRTTVVSFCNSKWTAGNHDRNAADLMALARGIHAGPVIYAGFSAGGLAAFLAAADDPAAVAYLGLDAVDSGGLGTEAAPRLRVPALFLLGEASACNAKGNFLPLIPRRQGATAFRVTNARHGHFENPYDRRVEAVCGRVTPVEASEAILDTIRSLATAWILDRATGSGEAAAVLAAARAGDEPWARRIVPLRSGGS